MKKWHPDQNSSLSHDEAVLKLEKIGTAYALLGNNDQTLRQKYDQLRNYQKYQSQNNLFSHLNDSNSYMHNETANESIKFSNRMKAKKAVFNYHGKIYNGGRNMGFESENEKKEREKKHSNQQNMFAALSGFSYLSIVIIFGTAYYVIKDKNDDIDQFNATDEMTPEDKAIIASIAQLTSQSATISLQSDPKKL